MDASERIEERTARLAQASSTLARNATYAGVLPALVIGLALLLIHPVIGIVAAAVLAVGWVLLVRRRVATAADVVLAGLATRPLRAGEAPRLENVLEGLCLTCGVSEPSVEVIDGEGQPTGAINAAVVASATGTRLVVTPALLADLERLQLEGVLANLLGRVRDGSAEYTTLVMALLGPGARSWRRIEAGLGDQRGVRSDLVAVDLTRYPPGLRSALQAMEERGTAVAGVPERSRPCWLAPTEVARDRVASRPSESAAETVDPADPQPLSLRIAVLAEL